jgi:hypothetical protein
MTTASAAANADIAPPRLRRAALALLIPIGPLAVAILPYFNTDNPATVVAKVAAHQGAKGAVLWLSLIAVATLVPGTIAIGLPAARRCPGLGTTALVVALVGFAGLPAVVATDQVVMSATRSGIDPTVGAHLLDVLTQQPTIAIGTLLFVGGHVIGLLLLGIALWRASIVPGWAGLLLAISQPLHFVFAVVTPNHLLDGCAWGLAAIGYAIAARGVLRAPRGISQS